MDPKTLIPSVWSKWRHADGGRYVVLSTKGQVKTGDGPWSRVVVYDHDDGTVGDGPYHTDLERFLERFTLLEMPA